jgi:hypothetical protein
MSSANSINSTTMFSNFQPEKLSFTELEENQRSKGQRIAYPRYDTIDGPLLIQFPWFHIDCMGVPSVCEFYPDDSKRDFIKIPLNQNIPEVKQLTEKLQALDQRLGNHAMREKLMGDKANKYEYQPVIRVQEDVPQSKDSKYKRPSYPFYMKLKLDTTYPDYKIKTPVFLSEAKEVDGKQTRIRTKTEVTTIDEMAKQVWLSKIRPIVRPVKLWAQPPNKKGASYGVTFKVVRLEVEPKKGSGNNLQKYMESDTFLDSDDETHDEEKQSLSSTMSKNEPVVKKTNVDSDEESDDVPVKTVPVSKLKTPVKTVEVDSDEESDDEPVTPVKKAVVKKVDSDDSDNEPKVTKSKNKFTVSKSKKANM